MDQKRIRVTRKDIALEAGVSETIVSYVLNNNRYVDKEKRKRVLDAVNKLGYRPNSIARALKGKRSNQLLHDDRFGHQRAEAGGGVRREYTSNRMPSFIAQAPCPCLAAKSDHP